MAKKRLSGLDKMMIGMIVGNFHVSTSDEEITAEFESRWPENPTITKAAVKYALKVHHDNRQLYGDVMGGRI